MYNKKLYAFPGLYDPDDVLMGLLEYGYFTDKIIPIFSSKQFYKFIISQDAKNFLSNNKKLKYSSISHRRLSNKAKTRIFSIPHPHIYSQICNFIKCNWMKINALLAMRWQGIQYNMACVRKIKGTNKIFEMNYASRTNIPAVEYTNISIGAKYVVEADISNFFPSIYTHSLGWSIVGREKAYKNRKKDYWYNELDRLIRNSQNEESHGIQIGPSTSNIIADIILSYVDKKLIDSNFKFRRYIDDYKCYVKNKDEADKFILFLSDALNELRLNLNTQKTRVLELPTPLNSLWVRQLRGFNFYKVSKGKILLDDRSISEISDFFDLAINLEKQEHNAAIFNYTIKMLLRAKKTPKAKNIFYNKALQLITIFPYLADFIPDILVDTDRDVYEENIKYLIENSLDLSDWASASYSIYASLKSRRKIENFTDFIDKIILSKDCILIFITYLYNKANNISNDRIIDFAKTIVAAELDDEYWVLIYELFKWGKLGKVKSIQEFTELKKYNISFLR